MHQGLGRNLQPRDDAWRVVLALLEFLESNWQQPDEGIWEVRGPRRQFTHSKVMAWVAFDRAVKAVERFGFEGPLERWTRLAGRDPCPGLPRGLRPRARVLRAVLRLEAARRQPADDAPGRFPAAHRSPGTGHGRRPSRRTSRRTASSGATSPIPTVDGLPPGEGVFLLCTFWLADYLALIGRHEDARGIFERLLSIRNDVGLLSESYDPRRKRLLGNFPQAFSHVGLVNTALNLRRGTSGPATARRQG